ncbi:MAG: histidine phosphatase family protein [Candidatus Obscuribacterales bacterium]|nr:histidine phosphatase family protein [Candidatus Obscuribacterales bacterium]
MLIYVMRHCESAVMRWRMDNPDAEVIDPQFIPDSDVVLSELGNEQGDALALYFAGLGANEQPTHAFFSPYQRAIQTGEKSLSKLPKQITPLIDKRLREIDFGIFAGLTKKGRAAKYPTEWEERRRVGKVNYRPAEGENWEDVGKRLDAFTAECIATLPLESVVLLSCHEVVTNVFRWRWENGDCDELGRLGAPTASITSYNYDGKTFKLVEKYKLPPSPKGRDLFSMETKLE